VREQLEKMLAAGHDGPLLRFSLGEQLLKANEPGNAAVHLAAAVEQDPEYSAAWKHYGQALAEDNRPHEAVQVFEKGIDIASRRGDHQAAKEMRVFAKRARKRLTDNDGSRT